MKEVGIMAIFMGFIGFPIFVSSAVIASAIELYINLNDEAASLCLNFACLFAVTYLVSLVAFLTWGCISWIIEKHKSNKGDK